MSPGDGSHRTGDCGDSMKGVSIDLALAGHRVFCVGSSARLLAKAELCAAAGAHLVWWRQSPSPAPKVPFEVTAEDPLGEDRPLPRLALIDSGRQADDDSWLKRLGARGVPLWLGADREASDLSFPARVTRGPLRITVDTGTRWPTLARWVRKRIEMALPPGLAGVLEALSERPANLREILPSSRLRRIFWSRLLDGPLSQRAHLMAPEDISSALDRMAGEVREGVPAGEVYLVGAGPGDPDLLTLKAMRLIGQADVVLYDRLVSPAIMERVRTDAERIHVGKARARHTVPQTRINEMLVDYARRGKTVVRLKGGDPFIFGRGGEEIATLAEAGINFQIVPGITAATGCAAYAGIPLTHRDYAQSVRFVTGHLQDGSIDLPWRDLVQQRQTLVFYMGLVGLPVITTALMDHGMPAEMPVALISRGTTPEQEVITGTLADIAARVGASGVRAPTIVIVGEVVKLRKELRWLNRDEDGTEPR